ncbi:MAG: preprotein translocase subunit YajC [Candidatus Eutrophobiaceae bacterium]
MNAILDFFISPAYAQDPPAQGGGGQLLFMMAVFFLMMYLLIIRPQMKQAKEHKKLIAALAKGDEVLTSGGILGRIRDVGDNFILLEIAERVEIHVQKSSISQVLPKGSLKAL